jgi:hypothetical protein
VGNCNEDGLVGMIDALRTDRNSDLCLLRTMIYHCGGRSNGARAKSATYMQPALWLT